MKPLEYIGLPFEHKVVKQGHGVIVLLAVFFLQQHEVLYGDLDLMLDQSEHTMSQDESQLLFELEFAEKSNKHVQNYKLIILKIIMLAQLNNQIIIILNLKLYLSTKT